ncbi:hypothetical protein SHAQ108633_00010 [Shewanella aquimarina]
MKVNATISEVKTYATKGYKLKSQYLYSKTNIGKFRIKKSDPDEVA